MRVSFFCHALLRTYKTSAHVISGKEIQVPHFLKDGLPPPAEDRFVWQKMARRIAQYRTSQAFNANQSPEDGSTLELLSFADMRAILVQQDSRIPEFNLFRLAYKWSESQHHYFLKRHFSFINFGSVVEQRLMIEIEPALKSSDVFEACWSQLQRQNSFGEETWTFIEKFALQKQISAKSVLEDSGEVFQLFVSSVSNNRHKLEELDDCIAALLVYLRQHDSSEFDLFQIVCNFGRLRHKYLLSEFVKDVDFARLSLHQRKLALVDLEPLEKRHVLRVENALYQSRILSDTDVGVLQSMFEQHVHRWVLYYADDECDQSRWKQLNDILQTDVFKMIVFRFFIDANEWVIAVCIAEKLTLRDTVAVNKYLKCRTQVFVSVHDEKNDTCLTRLADDYFLALDGHRLQIFVNNRAKDRTQTFVCLMNLEDSAEGVGMSVALNRFDRHSFSKEHNNAKLRRQEVSRFEIFLNQPTPMVAPAIIVGHYDEYRSLRNNALNTSPQSESFQYSARAFPRLDEEATLSASDIEEELQRIELKYYELKRKIATRQPIETELQDWMVLLQKASEVKYEMPLTCTYAAMKGLGFFAPSGSNIWVYIRYNLRNRLAPFPLKTVLCKVFRLISLIEVYTGSI